MPVAAQGPRTTHAPPIATRFQRGVGSLVLERRKFLRDGNDGKSAAEVVECIVAQTGKGKWKPVW